MAEHKPRVPTGLYAYETLCCMVVVLEFRWGCVAGAVSLCLRHRLRHYSPVGIVHDKDNESWHVNWNCFGVCIENSELLQY